MSISPDVEKESASGFPPPEPADDSSETTRDAFEVVAEKQDDPKSLPLWRRWVAALIINMGAICVTGASSMVRARTLRRSTET